MMIDNCSVRIVDPNQIENESMNIITSKMDITRLRYYPEEELKVVKRCIHTTADFDYQYNLRFRNYPVEVIKKSIQERATIITDTNMAKAGINKKILEKYGASVECFMADEDILQEAKERNVTRASICMERAARMGESKKMIFAIGNAPTALIRLSELVEEGFHPEAIIAVPVGFVNVIASKNLIRELDIPSIISVGRKGGSNIASAIINAILYQIKEV